jgi:glyceraldehyde-3-phosphate dehydrogenase/erythrose-4-phosphate dehydrogenase
LSVLNLQKINERIGYAANMLSKYAPEDIIIVSRRENGWKPAKLMGKILNVRVFAGRYPPGILINIEQFKKEVDTPPLTKDALLVEKDKANLPWRNLGVDYAMESTGFFTDKEPAGKYWIAGAKRLVRPRQSGLSLWLTHLV